MKKFGKVLLFSGVAAFVFGLFGVAGGLFVSLRSVRINETAGIGAIGGAWFELALLGLVVAVVGALAFIAGTVLLFLSRRSAHS